LKEKKMKISIRAIITLLTLALFLGACLPASSVQQNPQIQNTQSSQDVQSQVETAVVQTIQAQNQVGTFVAQTLEAQAPATFTNTPISFPTLTPFVIPSATNVPSSGGGGGSGGLPPKTSFSCDVIHLRPVAYAKINRGQSFDIKMTVVNNGTATWPAGYDFKYVGGAQMTTTTILELPAMKPNAQFDVVLDAVAPSKTGNQTMTWMVQGQLCYGYVVITVK
jgi:hypothetical protein